MTQRKIGITGGIGSGKSFVSAILMEDFGIPVYDCDSAAKRIIAADAEIQRCLKELVNRGSAFGKELMQQELKQQELTRKRLAEYLFKNEKNARNVNAIVHPAVFRNFCEWTERQKKPIVAIESAILFESGFSEIVDSIIFVDAEEHVRLKRAMQRDCATEQQIRARMKMQHPERFRPLADFVVDNGTDGSATLREQLADIIRQIETNDKTKL
ncbi:MAG: dephospho-CoA kinase [Prevotellaceae bacterium]|nr:dephospho-CoA kinase [Prevotellaceae bacterium]